MISASTLKRLWGYVSSNPIPRKGTLDILSRYVGRRDFDAFSKEKINNQGNQSSFFEPKYILSSELQQGDKILLRWNPNREIEIEYLGNFHYRVCSNANSHLMVGDIFEATSFMVGAPLCIPILKRGDEDVLSYIAGSKDGIVGILVE